MKRTWLVSMPFLFALSLAAWPSAAGGAAPDLGTFHQSKKLACRACHGARINVDDSESKVNAQCVGCHGSLAAIGALETGAIAPHRSHLGEISCTACHHAHTASQAYCVNCHSFALSIPFAGTPEPNTPPATHFPKVERADVVVIGSGGAGLTAAITAHDLGAKVIVIEKQPLTGGNSMLAAGGLNAAGTPYQSALGITDSPALMAQDTLIGGKNLGDPALVSILAESSAGSVAWLTSLGADLSNVGSLAGSSVRRAHRPTGGVAVGKHVIQVLRQSAAARNIDVRVNSKAVKILEDAQGRVTGVRVYGKHRRDYTIRARAVVMAAGGFSANPDRVAYYQPSYAGMTSSNQPGATGDGMDLGAAVNGQLIDMAFIQIHPTLAAGTRTLVTEGVRGNGAIMVNREGLRFVNEMTTRDVTSAAVLAQTGKTAFLIFDEAIRASLAQIEGYFRLGVAKEGETVEALAAQIAVPPAELAATIASYNQAYVNQSDPQWGRSSLPRPIDAPKFYAIEVAPGVHYTMGGLKIDTEAQVMSVDSSPIAGLFAAGEVTGGVHGANRLGGNSMSETITFGRIAGANAAKAAQHPGGCAR